MSQNTVEGLSSSSGFFVAKKALTKLAIAFACLITLYSVTMIVIGALMMEGNTMYGLLLIGGALIGLVFGGWLVFTAYIFFSTCLYEVFFNKGIFEIEEVYALGYEDKELYYQEKDKASGKVNCVAQFYSAKVFESKDELLNFAKVNNIQIGEKWRVVKKSVMSTI